MCDWREAPMRAETFDRNVPCSPADVVAADYPGHVFLSMSIDLMQLAVGAAAHLEMDIKALPKGC